MVKKYTVVRNDARAIAFSMQLLVSYFFDNLDNFIHIFFELTTSFKGGTMLVDLFCL